ncbi:980_t:CDS:1, partial [Funneliformis caledonium]
KCRKLTNNKISKKNQNIRKSKINGQTFYQLLNNQNNTGGFDSNFGGDSSGGENGSDANNFSGGSSSSRNSSSADNFGDGSSDENSSDVDNSNVDFDNAKNA